MLTNKIKEQIKLQRLVTNNTYKCKCGHSVVIYPFEHRKRKLCSWCNRYVFINKEEEFKYKLKERLGKNEK